MLNKSSFINNSSKDQLMNRFVGVFYIILLFNVFTVTKLPIRDLAFTTMDWTFYSAFFTIGFIVHKMITNSTPLLKNRLLPFYTGFYLLIFIYLISHIISRNYYENSELTLFLFYFVFLFAIAHIDWQKDHFIIFAQLSVLTIVLVFIHWILLDMPMSDFKSYIRNPNILAVFISCLLFFPIITVRNVPHWQKVIFGLSMGIALLMIYVSSSRAVFLLLVTVVGARIILHFSRKLFSALLLVVMMFNFIFLFIYTTLAKSSLFVDLNEWSVDKFGKNFFSGRQNVWESAFSFGLEKPFFGHKVGIVPDEYITDIYYVHVHNQYLQIFLESGLFGLIFFIVFLFGIWIVFLKNLDSNIVSWSGCFFLGILIYQNLEVSLFFNMQPIGMFQWLIIGIGLSQALYIDIRTENNI